MGFYKVRPGKVIGASGVDFGPGSIMELDERIAYEVRDRVDACDAAGNLLKENQFSMAQLDTVQPHERISLLEMERENLKSRLAAIEKAIEAEKEANATPPPPETTEPAPVPPPPPPPEPVDKKGTK